jgi:hypothetical protein
VITTILNTARQEDLEQARVFVSNHLHLPLEDVSRKVAVAYICKHFRQGSYEYWEGWEAMLAADRRN